MWAQHILPIPEGPEAWDCRAEPQLPGPRPEPSSAGLGTPCVGLGEGAGESPQGPLCGEQPVGGTWHSQEGGTAPPWGPTTQVQLPPSRCQLGRMRLPTPSTTVGRTSALVPTSCRVGSHPTARLRKLRPMGVEGLSVATQFALGGAGCRSRSLPPSLVMSLPHCAKRDGQ